MLIGSMRGPIGTFIGAAIGGFIGGYIAGESYDVAVENDVGQDVIHVTKDHLNNQNTMIEYSLEGYDPNVNSGYTIAPYN